MTKPRRLTSVFAPTCSALETRLAPSGNFLSHGLADVSREVNHLEHHHQADHTTAERHETHVGELKVRYDHIVANVPK